MFRVRFSVRAALPVLSRSKAERDADKRQARLPIREGRQNRHPPNRRLLRVLQFQDAGSALLFVARIDGIDVALHVEVVFGNFVMFSIEDFLESAHGLGNRNILTLMAGENFSDMEWLAKEPLDLE